MFPFPFCIIFPSSSKVAGRQAGIRAMRGGGAAGSLESSLLLVKL